MKTLLFVFAILLSIPAQSQIRKKKLTKGDTYALIIGISDYQDPGNGDLQFAHRDAEVFADYLTSAAGGSVPSDHIKLLTNEEATIANIYVAKKWLEDTADKDDLVYFYFSGHGNMESDLYKLGFLLAYDTPKGNYLNNAVRIEDINIMANTLSVKKDASVVLITDACHSGKLTGSDNRGKVLVGEQLATVERNEVRIASCEAHEESEEDQAWGGGRGAFSFYLINGLKGLADKEGNDDKKVTLGELRTYLENKVTDDVFELKDSDQTPVVQGKTKRKMAFVNEQTLASLTDISGDASAVTDISSRSINYTPSSQDLYFKSLGSKNLIQDFDFNVVKDWTAEEFMVAVFEKYPYENMDAEWEHKIFNNTKTKNTFKSQLSALLHTEVQRKINGYLSGDGEEMERRQFYNENADEYEEIGYMLDMAMKLIPTNHHLHHILEFKKYYFAGVGTRLKLIVNNNVDSLVSKAMEYQQKALALDDKAAYVVNEIGVLHSIKGEYDLAQEKYERAIALVPNWSIPKTNLSNILYRKGDYTTSESKAKEVIALQSNYDKAYIALGNSSVKLKNYLQAMDVYYKAIALNEYSFQGHDGLGDTYMHIGQYLDADIHYQIADDIKRGLFSPDALMVNVDSPTDFGEMLDLNSTDNGDICDFDTLSFGPHDVMANFAFAYENDIRGEKKIAERFYKKAINIDPTDPLSYHYLAKLMFYKKLYAGAEKNFQSATKYYLDKNKFNSHVYINSRKQQYKDCYTIEIYKNAHYDRLENPYFLGETYRLMQNYFAAENTYRALINETPKQTAPYYLIWEMHKERKLYEQAEYVIQEYTKANDINNNNELYGLYNFAAYDDYKTDKYHYRAGIISYNEMNNNPDPKSMNEYYLNINSNVDIKPSEGIIFNFPGPLKQGHLYGPINNPVNTAISHFDAIDKETDVHTQSDSLYLSDIYNKMGELFDFVGDSKSAQKNYMLANRYDTTFSSATFALIPKYIRDHKYLDAFALLNNLNERGQINYENLITLGEYTILSGNYTKADKYIAQTQGINPLPDEENTTNVALRRLLSAQYIDAEKTYADLLKLYPDDEELIYTLSRINAQLGKIEEAENYLMKAEENDFDYYWVLKNDPLIIPLHETDTYISMINKYKPDYMKE